MPGIKLTKRGVDAIGPVAKATYFFDTDLPGFFLRVMPTGSRAWGFEYRVGSGRGSTKRRITIASFGKLTPDEARLAARQLAGRVAHGQDPASEKIAKAREMTITGLVDLYEAEGCVVQRGKRIGIAMKPLTKKYTVARLRNHVVPLLGSRRVSEVTSGDIERMARDIVSGKTAKRTKGGRPRVVVNVKGGEGGARKVVRDLSAVFSFAVRRGIATTNPVATAAVRKTDDVRERFLSVEELGRLGAAFDTLENRGVSSKALNALRLLTLTGCRRNEIMGLRWNEVDLVKGLLRLADSKTGRSIRPLSAPAIALLETIPREGGSPFVFPAASGDSHMAPPKTIWAKVVKEAKLDGVTLHTLRHTLGAFATSSGEPLALTGAILGHANPRSTAGYAHVARDPAREAADRVFGSIAAALGAIAKKEGEVVEEATAA